MNIAIIGSGIIGLSTAGVLLDHGYQVSIYSKDPLETTTSMKAAAIWFPFKANPWQKVITWSRKSLEYYRQYSHQSTSGIQWVDFWVLDTAEQAASWIAAVPPDASRLLTPKELPPGYDHGYLVQVPMIDTSIFLPFLHLQISERAKMIFRKIESLQDLATQYDFVINCTGLEASSLTNDHRLYPIQGQIVKVEREENIKYMADDYGPNALAYIIPRHDCIVLGGTAYNHVYSTVPDPAETREILNRCRALHPGLKGKVLDTIVGLRPGRDEVRLEREQSIIHNYGHGGSGYTICWGCAEEVLELLWH
jgi:D-amino-acid oxidase